MAKKKSNKKSNKYLWIAAIAALIIAVLYFYGTNKTDNNRQRFDIEKSGAASTADFSKASHKVHAAVDNALSKHRVTAEHNKEEVKEVPRTGVEGKIRWHYRELSIEKTSDTTIETIKNDLTALVKTAGGEVLSSQPDHYMGLPIIRMDIGIRDNLGGEPVTIVTDKIIISREKTTIPKENVKISGELAIVIDDFGYTKEVIGAFTDINKPLTFAVIPYRPYSNEAATRGLSSGKQVILHLPMEPLASSEQSEEKTITVNMTDSDIQAFASKAIQAVPGIIGVNNHQGSRATAAKRVMLNVIKVVKNNSLFFIDSRTNSESVAFATARQLGVKTGENNIFLDNEDDVNAIKKQLRSAGQIAGRYGNAIAIGHARINTAKAITEMIPELEASGIRLVFASKLLK
ncbi:divergent polysaccharide deacetylase family protein [Dendrosporobacter sp. 1207_IL3150]|uniref:divergent polysaccharide deacetylase family protein n=1 Tax=Dendrosporobacter sp. 1207_IL3150 TaxID=3084054 RepID=UPI002FDAE15B